MAIVSRLKLDHPALGTAGGAALHTAINDLYIKIGDAISDRFFSLTDFDSTETVDLDHNFNTDITNLSWDLYNFVGGEWVLLTELTTPRRSQFSFVEKVGQTNTVLQITNNSLSNDLTVAVALKNDPIYLREGDVKDVDVSTVAPEDGQALVYETSSGKFKPGASGDSSFKLQSVTDPNAVIKGGYLILDSGIELSTDGTGADLTVSLDTILGGNPANATVYYLYVDLWSLSTEITQSNGRKVYAVVEANFYLSTSSPSTLNPRRYVPIGFIKSATTGTVWSGAGAAFGTLAARRHDSVAAFISTPQTASYQLTTAAASTITAHGLAGEPQVIYLSYFDGTKKNALDPSSHILNKGATNLEIATLGLTFGGGQYVQVQATYFPGVAGNVISLQHDFQSAWYQNTSVTTVAHGLVSGSIRGYEVQEWNVTLNTIRNIDRSALVVNFDDSNFYLNWSGLTPTANLRYRIVAGGTPIPASIPIEFGGFNKFVGFGPGSFSTLATAVAAAAPGDSILVNQSHTLAADLNINVADLRIVFMPNVVLTMAGSLTNGVRLTAARIKLERMHLRVQPTGAQARGISIEAADCDVDRAMVELNTAQTLTDAVHITVAGARAYVRSRLLATLGTITNGLTNNDGASSAEVWG
jgi:hypothetical protein